MNDLFNEKNITDILSDGDVFASDEGFKEGFAVVVHHDKEKDHFRYVATAKREDAIKFEVRDDYSQTYLSHLDQRSFRELVLMSARRSVKEFNDAVEDHEVDLAKLTINRIIMGKLQRKIADIRLELSVDDHIPEMIKTWKAELSSLIGQVQE